jgi:ElaB/YqjD/DUF883 family membrane-anchored ribosome-binding protein
MTDRHAEETERELGPNEQEQLVHEIEQTRVELGDTVDALSQKADVKARVSEKLQEQKGSWRERQDALKAKMNEARERASRATPDDAKRAVSRLARTAEQRPFPAIGVALGLGLLIGRTLGR